MESNELAKKMIAENIIADDYINDNGEPTADLTIKLFLILYDFIIEKRNK